MTIGNYYFFEEAMSRKVYFKKLEWDIFRRVEPPVCSVKYQNKLDLLKFASVDPSGMNFRSSASGGDIE